MGAAGVCWVNAVAESAFSSLKNEFHHHYSFGTRHDVGQATMRHIEVFYNWWRPHPRDNKIPLATAMTDFKITSPPLPVAA